MEQILHSLFVIVSGIFVFSILVAVHEFGHFLFAKLHHVGVLEFAIGFGPKLLSFRRGETTYTIRAIPLGGFVRMVGDDPRWIAPPTEKRVEEEESTDTQEDPIIQAMLKDESRWFLRKGFWPKAQIVIAGPAANFLLAFVVAVCSLLLYGKGTASEKAIIGDVVMGQPAAESGLLPGDRVLSINRRPLSGWEDLAGTIRDSEGRPLEFEIERSVDGAKTTSILTVTPTSERSELDVVTGADGPPVYRIGILPGMEREPAGIGESFVLAGYQVWNVSRMTVLGVVGLVTGEISAKHIAGPVFLFKEAGRSAKRGLEYVLSFMLFLSISLGILNLLPIPVLDGGHLLFFTIEAILRRPISLRVRDVATQLGMVFLLALMVFALRNDLFMR